MVLTPRRVRAARLIAAVVDLSQIALLPTFFPASVAGANNVIDLVAAVVAAGKPVFCEKPLGVDLAAAKAMVETVEAGGVINQVGLVLRASPAFRWLHEQVTSDATGAAMSMVFRDDQYIPIQGMYDSTWRSDPARAGSGALLEHSIHDLDLIELNEAFAVQSIACIGELGLDVAKVNVDGGAIAIGPPLEIGRASCRDRV